MKKWIIGGGMIIVTLIAIIIIPVVINELYKVNDGYITVWNGDDVLSFYGAAIGAIGTIILGIVAWAQNKRLLKLEETKYILEIQPFIMLTGWETLSYKFYEPSERTVQIAIGNPNNANCALVLSFTNTTNSFLTAEFFKLGYAYEQKSVDWDIGYIGTLNRKLVLQPNETGYITFIGTFDELHETCGKKKMKFTFMLENRFGDTFVEEFDAIIWLMKRPYENDRIPWNTKICCDNYHVKECKKNSNDRQRKVKNGQTENAHAE